MNEKTKSPSAGRNMPGESLKVRIAAALRQEIAAGSHPPGTLLPTEIQLSERFAVSRPTIREAIRILRDEGLVASRQGAGTVVLPPAAEGDLVAVTHAISHLEAFTEGASIQLLDVVSVRIGAALAERTGLPEGEEWPVARALGFRAGIAKPVGYLEYFINPEFSAVTRLMKRPVFPIYSLIEDLFCVTINEVAQVISASIVSPEIAHHLQVPAGSPALEVQHVLSLTDGKIAEVAITTHPAADYRHSVTMHRVKGDT